MANEVGVLRVESMGDSAVRAMLFQRIQERIAGYPIERSFTYDFSFTGLSFSETVDSYSGAPILSWHDEDRIAETSGQSVHTTAPAQYASILSLYGVGSGDVRITAGNEVVEPEPLPQEHIDYWAPWIDLGDFDRYEARLHVPHYLGEITVHMTSDEPDIPLPLDTDGRSARATPDVWQFSGMHFRDAEELIRNWTPAEIGAIANKAWQLRDLRNKISGDANDDLGRNWHQIGLVARNLLNVGMDGNHVRDFPTALAS